MKRITLLAFILLLIPFMSGEIIFNNQPDDIYNLGDLISVPVTIKASEDIMGSLNIQLLCSGNSINYKMGLPSLSYGQEYKTNIYIPLTKQEIGDIKGKCKIKAYLNDENLLTEEFKISGLINIKLHTNQTSFNPGENIEIEGEAIKENGENANGFAEMTIIIDSGNETTNITQLNTVNEGYFLLNASLPDDMKAGTHLLKIKVYEKSQDEITNNGFTNYNIQINQVPTNLEIVFEEDEVEPGTEVKVKAILHDQTGEKITSKAIITIKNNMGEILKQAERATDEFLEFPIEYNEPPAEWIVVAIAEKVKSTSNFIIKEKKHVEINIINKTLIIKNMGNVPYNKTIQIKIGNETISLDLFLEVDEEKKYMLSAPDGRYEIQVIANGDVFRESIILTGDTISIKEAKGAIKTIIPIVWIFLIAILGFVAFIVFKKGYKKSFFGYIHRKKEERAEKEPKKNLIISPGNEAELSLSIRGDKQNICLICIKIKNLKEIIKRKVIGESPEEKNIKEFLQKITDAAEEKKAATYFSSECLFFLLIPSKTKTFGNEKTAIEIAQQSEEMLNEHNKLAKQKIEFGISLNYGTIVAKQEKESLKFMSMGNLITAAKNISGIANKEILLSEKIKNRLGANIKTEKHHRGKKIFYKVKEIRKRDEHKNFIRNFLDRIEKD